ncbi:MAG: glycosyltransferase family 2 protein [Lachnospiraceae bacterium]|nr:glycosyltransferase family 2 protein [Lachnospiraceae bacterium]
MLPISICMIMKNEEKNLKTCLESVKCLNCELILVDTGSTDSTLEIAKKYTDKIYHFDWIHDFAAARNYSLSLAINDWVLVLDCDESISSIDMDSLSMFMDIHPDKIGLLSRRNHYEMNQSDSVYTDQVERFFNRKLYEYRGEVHEQVVPKASAISLNLGKKESINLYLEHFGYVGSPEELHAKAMRDAEILKIMLVKNPNDPYLYFQLGQSYNMLHDDEKALYYYDKGLSFDVNPEAEYVQMMVIGYGYALLHLERYEQALGLANIYDVFAVSADFICLMGLIYLRTGNLLSAMGEFLKAASHPVAHMEGANSFIPYYNMGCINELLGDYNMALSLYKKCGSFPMALSKIQELESKIQ